MKDGCGGGRRLRNGRNGRQFIVDGGLIHRRSNRNRSANRIKHNRLDANGGKKGIQLLQRFFQTKCVLYGGTSWPTPTAASNGRRARRGNDGSGGSDRRRRTKVRVQLEAAGFDVPELLAVCALRSIGGGDRRTRRGDDRAGNARRRRFVPASESARARRRMPEMALRVDAGVPGRAVGDVTARASRRRQSFPA